MTTLFPFLFFYLTQLAVEGQLIDKYYPPTTHSSLPFLAVGLYTCHVNVLSRICWSWWAGISVCASPWRERL